MTANNMAPALPVWKARSGYAMALLAMCLVADLFGFDIMAWADGMLDPLVAAGVLQPDTAVSEALEIVVEGALAFWAYAERRAPNFRLTLT